jgi:hypothetical protein
MRLWAGAAHFKGYEACVSAHYVVAASEKEAKGLVLDEASKKWPEWWRSYPYEIQVLEIPERIAEVIGNEELR